MPFSKKLMYKKRPYGSYYYTDDSAWMDSELMETILKKLNNRYAAQKDKILLFLDNVQSHHDFFVMTCSHTYRSPFSPKE